MRTFKLNWFLTKWIFIFGVALKQTTTADTQNVYYMFILSIPNS